MSPKGEPSRVAIINIFVSLIACVYSIFKNPNFEVAEAARVSR
jgi:hypothetical protein